jgi:hypothetical protein
LQNKNNYTRAKGTVAPNKHTMQTKTSPKKRKESTVGWNRTSDLPTLEREDFRNLGKADRSLGYQVGCADHCTTTAFWIDRALISSNISVEGDTECGEANSGRELR